MGYGCPTQDVIDRSAEYDTAVTVQQAPLTSGFRYNGSTGPAGQIIRVLELPLRKPPYAEHNPWWVGAVVWVGPLKSTVPVVQAQGPGWVVRCSRGFALSGVIEGTVEGDG